MNYYKVLNRDLFPCWGGSGMYTVGKWMPLRQPVPCISGYHVCLARHLPLWLGPAIHPAEVRGELVVEYDKHVYAEIKIGPAYEDWTTNTILNILVDLCEEPIGHNHYARAYLNLFRLWINGRRPFTTEDSYKIRHLHEYPGKELLFNLHSLEQKIRGGELQSDIGPVTDFCLIREIMRNARQLTSIRHPSVEQGERIVWVLTHPEEAARQWIDKTEAIRMGELERWWQL